MINPKRPRPGQLAADASALKSQGTSMSQGFAEGPPARAAASSAFPGAYAQPAALPPVFVGGLGLGAPPSPPVASGIDDATSAEHHPMPLQMQQYIQQLELWALANQKDARWDTLKLWSLKGPAIVAASLSGVLSSLHLLPVFPILIGVVGGVCVAIDGIVRPGKLRALHVRAVHDLRILENSIESQWKIASLRHVNSDEFAAKTLENAEKKKLEISEYLKNGEGSMQISAASK